MHSSLGTLAAGLLGDLTLNLVLDSLQTLLGTRCTHQSHDQVAFLLGYGVLRPPSIVVALLLVDTVLHSSVGVPPLHSSPGALAYTRSLAPPCKPPCPSVVSVLPPMALACSAFSSTSLQCSLGTRSTDGNLYSTTLLNSLVIHVLLSNHLALFLRGTSWHFLSRLIPTFLLRNILI